jgi:hypothetical protein
MYHYYFDGKPTTSDLGVSPRFSYRFASFAQGPYMGDLNEIEKEHIIISERTKNVEKRISRVETVGLILVSSVLAFAGLKR